MSRDVQMAKSLKEAYLICDDHMNVDSESSLFTVGVITDLTSDPVAEELSISNRPCFKMLILEKTFSLFSFSCSIRK